MLNWAIRYGIILIMDTQIHIAKYLEQDTKMKYDIITSDVGDEIGIAERDRMLQDMMQE